MTSLFQILKAGKTEIAPDLWTLLLGRKLTAQQADSVITYTGTVPTTITADGTPLISWTISGNMEQTGTPTQSSPIYPQEAGNKTANLFSSGWAQGLINSTTGEVNTSNSSIYTVDYIPIKPNTIYSMTRDKYTNYNSIRFYDANKNYIGSGTAETIEIISGGTVANPMRANQNFCCFRILVNTAAFVRFNDLTNDLTTKYMLVEGQYTTTTIPAYEPIGYKIPILCGGTTTPVYLGEVQSERQIYKLVLTGNEEYVSNTKNNEKQIFQVYHNVSPEGSRQPQDVLCSHLPTDEAAAWTSQRQGITMRSSASGIIFGIAFDIIGTTTSETAAQANTKLKAWLAAQYSAGTPVTVWYVLATPTTGILNEPLRKIGTYADSISKVTQIPTTVGSQTFDVDTTLKPSEVDLTYHGWHSHEPKEYSGGSWTE